MKKKNITQGIKPGQAVTSTFYSCLGGGGPLGLGPGAMTGNDAMNLKRHVTFPDKQGQKNSNVTYAS